MSCLVSIITPVYNASRYITETIESVLAQTYPDWELLLSDDCSTDDSMAIANSYHQMDGRVKLLTSEENTGPAGCRNRAIQAARGKYIAFLDSDDLWIPDKLELQVEFMNRGGYDVSFSAYQKIDEQSKNIGGQIYVPFSVNYEELLNSNVIPCLTAMYDAERLGKFYMEDIGHEDYLYWLKILKEGYVAHGIDRLLAYYRVRSDSLSNNKLKAASFQWNIYRNAEKFSVWKSLYHFSIYSYHGFRKHNGL